VSDIVAALVAKIPVTSREPRDAEAGEFVLMPPALRDRAD
jgi:hypothetical protein